MKIWYLEGYTGPRRALQRIRVSGFPFRIGRGDGLSLVLDLAGISREHAELHREDDKLILVDLNSTNGTFVNREPVNGRTMVEYGDILHFADEEFRLVGEEKTTGLNLKMTQQGIMDLPENLPSGSREFQQLLLNHQVGAVFQPIKHYRDGTTHAWEMLGRGRHPKLSESPGELFRIAESLGMEVHLSELLRKTGVAVADAANPKGLYFTNIHPSELNELDRLLDNMDELRWDYPRLKLVLEIHEAAVTNLKVLTEIRDHLRDHDILIAYDDFGRGQARIMELADVPPDYVKLDMELIRDIDKATPAKQQMVKMVTGFAHDNDILVVAEGINSDGEVQFCGELDIDLVQGYRFGKPAAELNGK